MASYSWNGGTGGWGTIANWSGGIPNSTTADATISASGSYTVTIESAKTYSVDSLTISDSGAILDVLGTLVLGGTLDVLTLSTGTLELQGVVSGGTVDIDGGSTLVALGGLLTGNQDFYQGGSAYIALGGQNLTLGGASTLQGYVTGPGALIVSGTAILADNVYFESGVTLNDSGTVSLASSTEFGNNGTAASVLNIGAGKVFDITAADIVLNDNGSVNITNAGLLEMSGTSGYFNIYYNSFVNTGTISVVGSSDISLLGATAALGGHVTGAGEIYLGNGNGTVSLLSGLAFTAGTLAVTGGESLVLEASQSLSTQFDPNYNANVDLNGFNLTLSGNNGGAVRSYVYGGGTLNISGLYDIGGLYLGAGTEELVTGTAIDDVNNTRLDYDNGTAASILSISGTGTYDITEVDGQLDYNGVLGTVINSGLFEVTETQGSYFNLYDNFTNASTGTIQSNAGDDISLLYGQDNLAGTITGAGELYIGQHSTVTLQGALSLNVADLTISDGSTDVFIGSSRTIGNTFILENAASINLAGNTLTVNGSGAVSGYVSGPGVLDIVGTYSTEQYFGGGVTEILSGVEYQINTVELDYDLSTAASVLSITSTGTYDINADTYIYNGNNNGAGTGTIINAGLFEKTAVSSYSNIYTNFTNTSTGTISVIAFNDISLLIGTNLLGGTISGAGELYLGQGSHTTLAAGLALSIADFTVSDGNTNVYLSTNLTLAKKFVLQSSGVINTNGHTLSLTGTSSLDAYLAGPGAVNVSGKADISGLYLTGKEVLLDTGTITQDGGFQFGNGSGDSGRMTVAAHAVFDILNNNGIGTYGTGAVVNNGLFEKTGDNGSSTVSARFNNNAGATLAANAGTIALYAGGNLGGTLAGAGNINLAGGVFTLAAKAVLNVATLDVDGGALDLLGNHTINTAFQEVGNGTINLGGFQLDLGNATLISSYIEGPGIIDMTGTALLQTSDLSGGARLIDSGTITQQSYIYISVNGTDNGALSIASTGTYDIVDDGYIYSNGQGSITNSGLFEKTADNGFSGIQVNFTNTGTGIVDAAYGDIGLYGGKLGGTLTGAGEIDLDSTNMVLKAAVVNVATLAINASPTLGNNIIYGGVFDLSANCGLDLNSYSIDLTGTANLAGGFEGPGIATVAGIGLVNLLNIAGGSEVLDTGTMDQVNTLRFGYYYDGTANTLAIAAGGTYDILNDSGFTDYINGSASANVANAGLLEKVGGGGISEIQPTLANTGTVQATTGTLQIDNTTNFAGGTLTGGVWEAKAATLLFETSAPITTDAATIILSGASARIYSGPSASTNLISSLTSIAATGTLEVLNGAVASSPLVDSGEVIVAGGTVSGLSVASGGTANISGGGVASGSIVYAGGRQTVSSGGTTSLSVVSSGGAEYVSSGGLAISSTVQALGSSTVYSGGVANNATIAGGIFDLLSGGTATGAIDFAGTGGELIIGSPTMPTTTISGFVAGETIDLAGVTYVSGATVTVATAGVVSIIDGSNTYKLNIAGATVGETDFKFSSGSLLTKTTTSAVMKFMIPAASHAPEPAGVTNGAAAARLFQAGTAAAPRDEPRAASTMASTPHFGTSAEMLNRVTSGGLQLAAHGPLHGLG